MLYECIWYHTKARLFFFNVKDSLCQVDVVLYTGAFTYLCFYFATRVFHIYFQYVLTYSNLFFRVDLKIPSSYLHFCFLFRISLFLIKKKSLPFSANVVRKRSLLWINIDRLSLGSHSFLAFWRDLKIYPLFSIYDWVASPKVFLIFFDSL